MSTAQNIMKQEGFAGTCLGGWGEGGRRTSGGGSVFFSERVAPPNLAHHHQYAILFASIDVFRLDVSRRSGVAPIVQPCFSFPALPLSFSFFVYTIPYVLLRLISFVHFLISLNKLLILNPI